MILLNDVKYDEVIGKCLQRERGNELLAQDEDYNDLNKNKKRLEILWKHRYPIIKEIPEDTRWFKAEVKRSNLASFRVIKDLLW